MELSNVLAFKPTIESQNDDNTGCNMERDFESTALVSNIDDYRKKETIPTKDLYPLSNELNQPLSSAFQLLDEGIQYISEAISFFIENDMFSSDDEVQKLQVLLPELFCCRDLGDGFGAIINSIFNALKNYSGKPLNQKQLQRINKLLKRIRTEPYISFEEAIEEIELLEEVGFEVEPEYIKFAADLLID